jgi:hypothetical protein
MAIKYTTINGSQKVWMARVAYKGSAAPRSARRARRPATRKLSFLALSRLTLAAPTSRASDRQQ